MVTVTVPVVAVLLAVKVNVLVVVAGFALNDAVTPLGIPDADKVTLPLKPFCGVTVIVLVPALPCVIVKLLGDAERVKFPAGTGLTVRAIAVVFDKLPDVPVMVTVTVPVVAVLLAVKVNVLVVVAGFALNDAVTPLGIPDADKVTLQLKPFCGVTVIVLVPALPCVIVKLLGDAERVKFPAGTGLTVRAIAVVFDKLPDVPVMVTVTVPVVAVLLAVKVNVLVVVAGFALNDAVTPLGSPDADKLTLPLKPFCGVTVIVLAPPAPCVIVKLLGDAERTKFGGAFTVSEIVVAFDKLPEVPAMVTVTVPVVPVRLAVSVNVLVVVAGFALNDAVTPLGSPDADKLTLPLKPFCGVTVIVLAPPAPCVIVKVLGDAERTKFGGAFTVSEIVVAFDKLPEVPAMVTVTVPVVAVPLAVSVNVLVVVVVFALNDAVTPLGSR